MLEVDFSPYKNKKVVVALSGGADSVALFALFCENVQKYGISPQAARKRRSKFEEFTKLSLVQVSF